MKNRFLSLSFVVLICAIVTLNYSISSPSLSSSFSSILELKSVLAFDSGEDDEPIGGAVCGSDACSVTVNENGVSVTYYGSYSHCKHTTSESDVCDAYVCSSPCDAWSGQY